MSTTKLRQSQKHYKSDERDNIFSDFLHCRNHLPVVLFISLALKILIMFSHLAQKEYKQGVVIDKKGITFFYVCHIKMFWEKNKK